MSTLQEHIQTLQAIAQKERNDANSRDFAFHANLTLSVHLNEVVALLDAVAKPADCAARLIAGIWQCDHCGYFELTPPGCAHKPDALLSAHPVPEEGAQRANLVQLCRHGIGSATFPTQPCDCEPGKCRLGRDGTPASEQPDQPQGDT